MISRMQPGTQRRAARAAMLAAATAAFLFGAGHAANAETRMVEGHGGLKLALTTVGKANGPDLLLIHSFQASTLNWEKQLSGALAEKFAIAAPDLRGHGSSAKPWDREAFVDTRAWADDIEAIIREAKLEKPIIVAASYGGLFVMNYVRHHGTDKLGGIVFAGSSAGLLKPPPPPEDTPERRERVARSTSPDLPTIMTWTKGFIGAVGAAPPISDADKQKLELSALLTPHYVRAFLRDHRTDNSDMGPKLKDLPVLFIVGDKDVATPVDSVRKAAATVPGAEVKVYEGVGSLVFWAPAERFNADVTAFAEKARAAKR
jgi:pimeloyl-ACP methyl ester carboxylesterase